MPDGALLLIVVLLIAACVVILLRVRQTVRAMTLRHEQLMRSISDRRDELEAALSSMVEGVLAVDLNRRLISFNKAAGDLLNLRHDRDIGKGIEEVIASEPLWKFIIGTLNNTEPIQDDIELSVPIAESEMLSDSSPAGMTMRMYELQGAVLRHPDGHRIGSLIVLHDVTRLRRLEVVRRDFVANASHEIRTPVAAIRMAAETLDETQGEVDDSSRRRFMNIIVRQSERLSALIDDLLSLARIERDTEQRRIAFEHQSLRPVLESAAETCQTAAAPRGSSIVIDCASTITAPANPALLEQAVVNLLDNAIKYSPDGSTVTLTATKINGEVTIIVTDRGTGIAPEHLPRIFERFYRTDRARGRDIGGTGLGLAIVKHIALAHHGRVSVESDLNRGSTFRIHLPATSVD